MVQGAAPPAGVQGAELLGWGQGAKPHEAYAFYVLDRDKNSSRACISLLKMTEKLILITLIHPKKKKNTHTFSDLSFFETFRGICPLFPPPPCVYSQGTGS